MITPNDYGKTVFLLVTDEDTQQQKWRNDGVKLVGMYEDGSRLKVRLKDGQIWAIKPEFVRVFEPRPGIK